MRALPLNIGRGWHEPSPVPASNSRRRPLDGDYRRLD